MNWFVCFTREEELKNAIVLQEWADYDEKAGLPVEINEMSFKFAIVKE
jgi:hypothetical protein